MRLQNKLPLTRLVLSTLFSAVSVSAIVLPAKAQTGQPTSPADQTAPVSPTTTVDDSGDTVVGRLTSINGTVARVERANGEVELIQLPTRQQVQQFLPFVGSNVVISNRNSPAIEIARTSQVDPATLASTSVSQPEPIRQTQIETQPSQSSQTQTDTQSSQTRTETQTTQTQTQTPTTQSQVETQPAETQPTDTQPIQQPDNTQPDQQTQPADTQQPVRALW